jgi:hypothetical protein
MSFNLPKPIHGWRTFAGEVGIIVIGVLIALTAQQLVETAHWRAEVKDFRRAVGDELGMNLAAYQYQLVQRPCVARRLADLDSLLNNSLAGRKLAMVTAIGRPDSVSFYFSVWDSKEPAVTAHLPNEVRQSYAQLYDEYHNADVVRLGETDVWRNLAQFDQPEPLDHSDRMRLRELITKARQLDSSTRANWAVIEGLSSATAIKPLDPLDNPLPKNDPLFCNQLLQ